jgi:hypothetical protein
MAVASALGGGPSTFLRGAELMSKIPDLISERSNFLSENPESDGRPTRSFIARIYSFYSEHSRPISMKKLL